MAIATVVIAALNLAFPMPVLKGRDVDEYAANNVVLIILKRKIITNEHRSPAPFE